MAVETFSSIPQCFAMRLQAGIVAGDWQLGTGNWQLILRAGG